jgi:hypothetical protein
MGLNDIVASAFSGATAKLNGAATKLRRNAILYTLCAFCAVAAIVFAASASVLALEPHVGMVYARLILAAVFAVVVVAIVLALRLSGRPAAAPGAQPVQMPLHAQAQTAQRSAQFAQLAMIVEAVLLGYSMARRR